MKRDKISNNVIRRLPRYLRKMDDLIYKGVERISSAELGRQMGLTPSQIRQDFSCFGEFGQQGYGYNVAMLRDQIKGILGMNCGFSAVLIGVGNLGHALIENFGFSQYGLALKAAFDVNKGIVDTLLMDIPIYHEDSLSEYLAKNDIDIAVICVPRRVADSVAEKVIAGGVKAIWNFTNIELNIGESDVLVENIHFSDSLLALSYYLAESLEEGQA